MSDPAARGNGGEDPNRYEDDAGLDIEVLRRRRERFLTFLALLIVLAVTVFVAVKFFGTRPVTPAELASVAQRAVRQAMPGVTVQIGGPDGMNIKAITDSMYEVSGQFSTVNSQAGSAYYVFTCSLERAGGGGWRPESLKITPLF